MKQILIELISQVYEILLRFMVFATVSWGVTTLVAEMAPLLTASLWVIVSHYAFGFAQVSAVLALLTPVFCPEAFWNCGKRWSAYIDTFKEKYADEEKTIKDNGISPDSVIRSAERAISKLIDSGLEPAISTAIKSAYDGLQTAVAMLNDPETTMLLDNSRIEDVLEKALLFGGDTSPDKRTQEETRANADRVMQSIHKQEKEALGATKSESAEIEKDKQKYCWSDGEIPLIEAFTAE